MGERKDTPAADCADLDEVRAGIDRLDREIVRLLARRHDLVRQAARFKKSRADVVDPPRIEAIVREVRRLASESGMDPDLAERVYRTMIDGFIAFEMAEHDRLSGDG